MDLVDGPPTNLPLLPLLNQVLLPTAFARLQIPSAWQSSVSLLEHLLKKQGRDVLVAVVPVLEAVSLAASKRSSQAVTVSTDDLLDLDKMHARGTAARVLQLSRNAQTGDWSIALEGCYRVEVGEAAVAYPHAFYTVEVLPEQVVRDESGRAVDAKLDADGERVAKELADASMRLLATVQVTTGSPAAARLAEVLGNVAPSRAADLLASILVAEPLERLAVLDAMDVTQRMRLVLGFVVKAHKTMLRAASAREAGTDLSMVVSGKKGPASGRDAARVKALRQLQAAQRSMGGVAASKAAREVGSDEEDEDDEEEISALLRRIKDAKPPPEVLKVAMREAKRLQRSNEQHPGYAMSRAYLETLADLPWNSFAGGRARPGSDAREHAQGDARAAGMPSTSALIARLDPRPGADRTLGSRDESSASCSGSKSEELSLAAARAMLDEQHHGLDKVKERIVQYLAVRRLRGWDARAPILCFIGPPGVGKTSLARSVANVLGRPFHRIALGGVRDEAEVRGHRRTYIGAMPGRIVQGLRRTGVRDPVMLLDEVDKLGRDSARGDPSSALLEVLDPEQNHAFVDTYLGVPFDLSKVVFLATGNRLTDLPAPLLDRLEVISLTGYTLDEKVHIAQKHLLPQLLEEHGLQADQLLFPPAILRLITEGYTREAGVRSLSRCLAAICRHVAVHVLSRRHFLDNSGSSPRAMNSSHRDAQRHAAWPAVGAESSQGGMQHVEHEQETGSSQDLVPERPSGLWVSSGGRIVVNEELIEDVLGPRKYSDADVAERIVTSGVAAGLVWTAAGGAVQYVECCCVGLGHPDKPGRLQLTGQVGEVLEESARIALSWMRSHAAQLGIRDAGSTGAQPALPSSKPSANAAANWDVHVHLPAGGVPKDGPSAGITLAVALASLFLGRCARADTAMTGELTLRGLVLPIGGLKEKLLAAHSAGVKRVLVPRRNMRDVKGDLPAEIKQALQIIPVDRLEDVLREAFEPSIHVLPLARL
ncbi:hypothetical protein WJX72_003978 [[Myrmecia] bisecta]|uniref:Lon protease homolog n=1 Tax=[Myrmecia] bisecta TaxID=41462 RepID=A0AAW1PNJ9_9CHLO